jgi:uncharacterized protein YjbJ (UPF0337 family)
MAIYNENENEPRRTPAEVAAEASVEHTGKGVLNAIKGTARQAWGKITGSRKHQIGGKVDELKGRAQMGLGKFEAKEAEFEARHDGDIGHDDTLK